MNCQLIGKEDEAIPVSQKWLDKEANPSQLVESLLFAARTRNLGGLKGKVSPLKGDEKFWIDVRKFSGGSWHNLEKCDKKVFNALDPNDSKWKEDHLKLGEPISFSINNSSGKMCWIKVFNKETGGKIRQVLPSESNKWGSIEAEYRKIIFSKGNTKVLIGKTDFDINNFREWLIVFAVYSEKEPSFDISCLWDPDSLVPKIPYWVEHELQYKILQTLGADLSTGSKPETTGDWLVSTCSWDIVALPRSAL